MGNVRELINEKDLLTRTKAHRGQVRWRTLQGCRNRFSPNKIAAL
jgi:hypothetical protein